MAVNLQQVIMDAKKLCSRMKDDETKSDTIISQSKSALSQIQHMKQYSDDVEVQNEAASQRSQSVLVAGLQRETQHMRELEAENRELRAALDDYQTALELIMSKYRQQVSKLMKDTHSDVTSFHNNAYSQIVIDQYNQIRDMRAVMRRAATLDEEETIRDKELIAQLATENKGLREMFNLYEKYGCQKPEEVETEPVTVVEPEAIIPSDATIAIPSVAAVANE